MRIFAFGCSLSQYFYPTWADVVIHEYKQKGRAYLLVLDRDKLPELNPADEGNYWTAKIPLDAVKQAINLQDLAKR